MKNPDSEAETALNDALTRVHSRSDLVAFVELLRRDWEDRRDQWENESLSEFLDGLAAWTNDMDGFFTNRGEAVPNAPSWGLIALMLAAARVYE